MGVGNKTKDQNRRFRVGFGQAVCLKFREILGWLQDSLYCLRFPADLRMRFAVRSSQRSSCFDSVWIVRSDRWAIWNKRTKKEVEYESHMERSSDCRKWRNSCCWFESLLSQVVVGWWVLPAQFDQIDMPVERWSVLPNDFCERKRKRRCCLVLRITFGCCKKYRESFRILEGCWGDLRSVWGLLHNETTRPIALATTRPLANLISWIWLGTWQFVLFEIHSSRNQIDACNEITIKPLSRACDDPKCDDVVCFWHWFVMSCILVV